MDRLELLYDHYKESFSIIKQNEKIRNQYFVFCGLIICLLVVVSIEPNQSIETIKSFLQQQSETPILISFCHIQSFIWVLLLYCLIKYYHTAICIDNQYIYLQQLELKIEMDASESFCRESKAYNNNYSIISDIIYWSYIAIFPVVFAASIIIKIIAEVSSKYSNVFFDTIIASLSFLLIIVYMFERTKEAIRYYKELKLQNN